MKTLGTRSLRHCRFPRFFVMLLLLLIFKTAGSANISTFVVVDSVVDASSDQLEIQFKEVSNSEDLTTLKFNIISSNTPFSIYKIEWINKDNVLVPLEPFSLTVNDEVEGKKALWRIVTEFPYTNRFTVDDVLLLYTDRGTIRCRTSYEGALIETIDMLQADYEKQLETSTQNTRRAWTILGIILMAVVLISLIVFIIVRQRFIQKRREIENLSFLIAERTEHNLELKQRVDALYGSRLDTLNMLCNEFFEKSDSEKVKLTIYNDVEKHILALRDTKSIVELEGIVNTYLDNIMTRVKEQIPELTRNDLVFLTYLYAGFSPRAICIFTDIKIKNFYNRRSRLKDRILASDAPDREFFVSKMSL